MKKLLPLLTLCMSLCCVSCYDDSPILERLDALEKNAIASINEQINAIKASITSLEAVDAELKSTIKDLEAKDGSLQGDIDKLKEADTSLETKIGELKTYVDAEISNTEDWATATFATIEQYNEIVKELSSLKEVVESNYATLDKKIDDSIESIKTWVNEALKSYYSSEEVDELLNSLKDDLDALQAKLDNLLRDFIITFDDSEIGILAGGTTSVGYTITGATEKTTVKALGQNGWSAKVTPNGTDKGTITVTAPNPLTEDEIIVLVYDGEYRTIMSSINFVTGVVTPSQTAVELEAEAGTIDITITSNLNYKVSIPEDAKDWLSVIETKSTKIETVTFAYTECSGGIRQARVSLSDEAENLISEILFIQQGSSLEVTLTEAGTLKDIISTEVAEKLKGLTIIGDINGTDIVLLRKMSNLKYLNLSSAHIVSGGSTYPCALGDGIGYTSNNTIGDSMFSGKFSNDGVEVILPNDVRTISYYAFQYTKINSIEIPSSVQFMNILAFANCGLKKVTFHEGIISIDRLAFQGNSLESIVLPSTISYLGNRAFDCSTIKSVYLNSTPEKLSTIGTAVFGTNYDSTIIYVPKGTKEAFQLTQLNEYKNIIEVE